MTLTPVESSNIDAIGYEPSTKRLFIKFKSGGTYRYENVEPEKHQKLVDAKSIGVHFHKHIRDNHDCERCR